MMARPPATYPYLPISSSGEQAHNSDPATRDDRAGESEFCLTNVQTVGKAQTKWLCLLLGCAVLLPWSALVNGMSFFLFRLADSPFSPTFGSYCSSIYTLVKLVCQLYCTITSKESSPSRRIFASITLMIPLVMSLWFSTFIRSSASSFFSFVLFTTASLAAAAAYLCTAVYAWAGLMGPSFLQAVLSGHAAISVIASIVNVVSSVISLWGLPPKPVSMYVTQADGRDDRPEELAARIFFAVSAIFFGMTLVVYARLTRDSARGSITGTLQRRRQAERTNDLTRLLSDEPRNSVTEPRIYQIFKQNIIFMFSIAYSLMITLAIFPAVTIRVQPVNPGIHPMLFTAVHLLVFNIADLLGRCTCSSDHLSFWSAKKILVISLLRTLFIPTILVCNINRPVAAPSVLPVIRSDVFFVLVSLLLGYTQGAVLTLATLGVSSLEHNPRLKGRHEDVEIAATLSGALAIVGLAAGSLSSFAVQAMI